MKKLIQGEVTGGKSILVRCGDNCGIMAIDAITDDDDPFISISYYAKRPSKKGCGWEVIITTPELNELINGLIEIRDDIVKKGDNP